MTVVKCNILLIDDDDSIRSSLEIHLSDRGFGVESACNGAEGLQKLRSCLPSVVLLDLNMPDRNGLDLIKDIHDINSAAAVIIITGYGDIDKAVHATKMGAAHFIQKPFSLGDIDHAIDSALSKQSVITQMLSVEQHGFKLQAPGWTILGVSEAMKDIYRKILMVSENPHATVLIQGESGTGKELIARAIYINSQSDSAPFIDINCAALSDTLLESELFGYEKGAFTGASETRSGLFGAADGGVLFLDEIGEMPLKLQANLLRVLEERTYKRVGGVKNLEVDCRVIASTNRDLYKMVEAGTFRKDLFFRLDVFSIYIPPLRNRPEDIPVLSSHFLREIATRCNKKIAGFTDDAMERLLHYSWPGNIRELRNVIERAVILARGATIDADKVIISPDERRQEAACHPVPVRVESIRDMEKRLIMKVLNDTDWHKAKTADILGINRTTLWQKLKSYGIEDPPAP